MNVEREKLIDHLKRFSVKKGEEFTLSSGQKSNIYIDVKKTMLKGENSIRLAEMLWDSVWWWAPRAVAGVGLGGYHLASIVSTYGFLSSGNSMVKMDTIYVRKEAKDYGTKNLIEAPHGSEDGGSVVLLEDVITTGQSVLRAARILEESGFTIKGIVAIVDRRADKTLPTLGEYSFRALVDFEELIEE